MSRRIERGVNRALRRIRLVVVVAAGVLWGTGLLIGTLADPPWWSAVLSGLLMAGMLRLALRIPEGDGEPESEGEAA